MPTINAIDASHLGKLGKLMLPYQGCPRGAIGERGYTGRPYNVDKDLICLDPVKDIDGNYWVPVLKQDLELFKRIVRHAKDGGDN